MVNQHQAQRRGRILGGVRPTGEDHRATTFELLFDLVYVFALTQVTGYMGHAHSAHGVLQGLLLLALPAAIVLPPLVGLAVLVLILAALIVVETTRYAQTRRN